jgi:hypothetical protein
LQRAFWNLAAFTLVALVAMPPTGSSPAVPPPNLLPARALFLLGAILWLATAGASIHSFFRPEVRPSFIATFMFLLLLGLELFALGTVAI